LPAWILPLDIQYRIYRAHPCDGAQYSVARMSTVARTPIARLAPSAPEALMMDMVMACDPERAVVYMPPLLRGDLFWLPFASVRLIEDEALKIDVSSRANIM